MVTEVFLNSSADEPPLTEPKDACYLALGLENVGATLLVKYDAQGWADGSVSKVLAVQA